MNLRLLILTTLLASLGSTASAQKIDVDLWEGMKTRCIGPAGMSGRVTSIDVVLNQPDIIYIGTASGGVWKSISGGIHWEPVFDDAPIQSIGAVAIDQRNPNVVWAGTGEGNPRNSHSSGAGIYKSIDAGRTWQYMGLKKTKTIHRILINPHDPDIVYVAALGSAWGNNVDRGVFMTTNGGESWKKILYVNDRTGAADLIMDPTNPNKLIAAMWEHHRQPWFFTSGGEGSGIYVSFDGGKNWKKRDDKHGLPEGELGRVGLAMSYSKPNIVYALVEAKKTALYKSQDGGMNWAKVSDKNIGNRPFYYADIFVDPQNENRIYNLYSVVSKSEDGGKTFEVIMPYSTIHPDHHAFWIHPEDPDFIIDGNDGGLNISRDGGKSWQFVENLPLAQFYHINIDNAVPYNVYGGMQDNGSWVGPSQVWKKGGIRNSEWREVLFGDGFDVVPFPDNNRYGYAMYQGGNLYVYDVETGKSQYIRPVHPEGIPLRFNWSAAIAQDPFRSAGVYFGSQFVHKSTDRGRSWTIISPDLTTNDTAKQKQGQSGGLTIDATNAENYTTILCIAPSPLDSNVIWVGTDDGNLQLTKDGGRSWTLMSNRLRGVPSGSWIPQIEVSKHKAGEAFVVINNYRRNDWKPYVYRTTDFGETWSRIVSPGQVSGHAHAIVQDPVQSKLLFLGTEHGLYFSMDLGGNWNKWNVNFPSVPVTDLKIHPREHDLIVGTFGRAAYILDDIRPLRALASQGTNLLEEPLHVFDPPDATLASLAQARGTRFAGNAHFKGKNRPQGALLSYWIKTVEDAEKKEETSNAKKEQVKISVFNVQGDTIRVFTAKADTGLNRTVWDLSRNGVRYPSFQKIKDPKKIPPGPRVLPGKYKIRIRYRNWLDSTHVTVLPDPRLSIKDSDRLAKEDMIKAHMLLVEASNLAVEQLKAAQSTIQTINQHLSEADSSAQKQIRESGKAASDSIKVLLNLFMPEEDFSGIDAITVRSNLLLGRAGSYVNASVGEPTAMAKLSMENAKSMLSGILKQVNAFFDNQWSAYEREVKEASIDWFKTYKPVGTD